MFPKPFQSAFFAATVFAMLFCCHSDGTATPDSAAAGQHWWSSVQHLASDQIEGRLTGSEGYRRAAQYVTEQSQASGLAPKGVDGYLQPVRFNGHPLVAHGAGCLTTRQVSLRSLSNGQNETSLGGI